MLKIRLEKVGRKHEPAFRLVLTDSENAAKSGRFKEILGSYDPRKSSDLIKADRVNYWLGRGATLSDTVHNLLVSHKIVDAKKKNVLPKKTVAKPTEAPASEATPIEAAPAEETATAIVETPAEAAVEEASSTPETPAE